MMRCSCCNRLLNSYESTLKHAITGEYLDTCVSCLEGLDIPTNGRKDFNPYEEEADEDLSLEVDNFLLDEDDVV